MCILCGFQKTEANNICDKCQHDFPILPDHCQQCAQFLSTAIDSVCGTCLTQPPPFDRTYALFPYEAPIMQLIIRLKFRYQLTIAKAFGELLADKIENVWYKNKSLPDLIIPVPLHPKRLQERGFNQAIEIAKPIAKAFNLPIERNGIKRLKPTAAQSTLPANQRKYNIADAFEVSKDYSDLSIAVIDDVITTGYTIAECCHVLKQHGAKQIDVWCCARRG